MIRNRETEKNRYQVSTITPRHHVNNHTTTPQYSTQRQPIIKNSSIDSITQHEYFEIILEKVYSIQ